MKRYSEEHEWVIIDGDEASIGISKYAVEQLGDITFMELPELDASVHANDSVAFVESVKAASDIYTPVSGTITQINESLLDQPEQLNGQAQETFIFKIKLSNKEELEELMDEETYTNYIETL